jgi:putative transposase
MISDTHLNGKWGQVKVKHLRDENARLKKLVADLSLDKDMLQSVIRKTPSPCSTKGRSEALAGGVPG